ncbi:MAG: hypothetical protein F4246_02110 [Rhodothermaceae bacterium]|nr:hypothetical protein [Rhodothermaceae bacterium]MXX58979.1 hypothetical protein [Rhodothermaceae bacterium]MYD20373.1 hypothetical protein [Rhodothermaceae bacterium]MYD55789.1 hypothetical protein [Rhodothermaceae bacterium]MYI43990.1 hypothetical protein [Rhodothermaceae bacterium]
MTRLPRFTPFGLIILTLMLAGIVNWMWFLRQDAEEIDVGQVYLRAGLPDSAMVSEILTTAPNEAGYLMVTILAYDRLVRIDQVGRCTSIRQIYEASREVIPLPVHLPDQEACFAYRIRFDVPLPGSETALPLTVAVIHPDEDRRLLHKPSNDSHPLP